MPSLKAKGSSAAATLGQEIEEVCRAAGEKQPRSSLEKRE